LQDIIEDEEVRLMMQECTDGIQEWIASQGL
jgi:hypothetical protein